MLNNMVFPYSKGIDASKFYELVTELVHDLTPKYEELIEWINVVDGFSKLDSVDISKYAFIFDEEKLCRLIESKKTLDEVHKNLAKKDNYDLQDLSTSIIWFNNFFNLLSKEQTQHYTSDFNIIPNQKKELIKRTLNVPCFDNIGNEKIKTVSESFEWDIKSELIYPGITFKNGVFLTYNMEKVLTSISNLSDKITEEQLIDARKRKAHIIFLKWLIAALE